MDAHLIAMEDLARRIGDLITGLRGLHDRGYGIMDHEMDDFATRLKSLSKGQRATLSLRCSGLGNVEIAHALYRSPDTIKGRLAIIYRTFDIQGEREKSSSLCYKLGRYDERTGG